MKRVYLGSIATETNSFSPLRADLQDFIDGFYAPPGEHPATPTLCSAVYPVARAKAPGFDWELIEGTATWAEPSGIINHHTWRQLRDEILGEIKQALPVDIILLGLHGAMMSQEQPDCEGELLQRVRTLVGTKTVVGITMDPHSHLTSTITDNADLIVAFKEFPHTDFVKAAEDLAELANAASNGQIIPQISVFDARMIDVLPTNTDPMKCFIARIKRLERLDDVVSISLIHGFMAGDSPDLGAKIVVITDAQKAKGDELARKLGLELYALRGHTRPEFCGPEEALIKANQCSKKPVVIADVWDNPGGGVPGDSTVLIETASRMGLKKVVLGSIWDPIAVRICKAAGEGSLINLRFGAKTSATAGNPIDAEVKVLKIVENATQNFNHSIVSLGDAAVIEFAGIKVILNDRRCQTYSPSLFTNLGIDPQHENIVIVKSTNHFYSEFSPIAEAIIYVSVDGVYPHDPRTTQYRNLTRKIWPISLNPFKEKS